MIDKQKAQALLKNQRAREASYSHENKAIEMKRKASKDQYNMFVKQYNERVNDTYLETQKIQKMSKKLEQIEQ